MIKFEIKNRYTGAVQFEAEIDASADTPLAIKIGLSVRWAVSSDADLRGADLRDAYLGGANLRGANLVDADLRDANLGGANLGGANLVGADLRDAYLGGANLGGANLVGADLVGANLVGANLRGANLVGANLVGANLVGANLGDANLGGADLGQDQRATITPALIENLHWPIMITDRHIKIGGEVYTTEEWAAFTDKEICALDGSSARKFWGQWKVPLLAMARAHQSGVAGGE